MTTTTEVPDRNPRPRTPVAPWPALAALGVPLVVFLVHASRYGMWTVDDAAITWAYARSIAEGQGPVLQPGVPAAEGWSNPTWLALFIPVAFVGASWVLAAKALSVACATALFAVLFAIARRTTSRPVLVAVVAGTATALLPSFVIWSVSGLENPLYALLVVVMTRVLLSDDLGGRRTPVVAGLLAAALALTRPDGLVYVAAFPLVAAYRGRRGAVVPVLLYLASTAVPLGTYLTWRHATFHRWVPNTAVAKGQGFPTLDQLPDLAPYSAFLGLAVALVVVGLATRKDARRDIVGLTVPLVLALTAFFLLDRDWMGALRFATPVWPLAAATTSVCVAVLGRVVAVPVALAVTVSLTAWWPLASAFRAAPTVPVCLVAQIDGLEFTTYADRLDLADGTLLVPDVGGAALVGRLRVVDLAGLSEPALADDWSRGAMGELRDYVYLRVRPTFIAAHGTWATATGVLEDPRLREQYAWIADTDGGQIWVRRDVLRPGDLDRLRAARTESVAVEQERRAAPRASCSLRPEN